MKVSLSRRGLLVGHDSFSGSFQQGTIRLFRGL
jgi:hypothetical protein